SLEVSTPSHAYYLNVYSESDAKNQPLQQDITQEDKALLASVGDNVAEAYKSGIDSVGFNTSNVLYALRDSLGFDSVLVYSTHPDSALYRVVFTYVGKGNGDYTEDGFTAVGRTFRWLKPEASEDQLIHR